jgi:hypothetical protein
MSSEIKSIDKNDLLKELLNKQLKNINIEFRLKYSDLKRICKYIKNSIFDQNNCCIWEGYITNYKNTYKGTYVNFYYRKKKVALHRLLYNNFVSVIGPNEYIKFSCENKGRCCNINHFNKFEYNRTKNTKMCDKTQNTKRRKKVNIITEDNANSEELKTLHVSFD